ncbi:hypothetical protein CJ255_06435 [Candidatus Viridilinea mediisalina]|uniref:Uncharacterized protein n=1 Tax=Candidatus Viridilinea mediisalina TaxID=2024553 RepID=A0A2A6RLS9_9CHLR|nr:hypothetical protein CJ255_06435 [Candidatus Viridilinea mediisalina]
MGFRVLDHAACSRVIGITVQHGQTPARQRTIITIIAGMVVLLMQWWLLYPLHQTMDLPIWD